jgi:hypothetical protein
MAEVGENRRVTPFDELAHELYGTTPEAFTSAREECVKQAREAGDKALARELAKLRRPTQSAWLVNQLVRDDEAPLDDLLGMVDKYASALSERDGARLTELTATRRQLENQLIARAGEIGAGAGTPPSDGTLQEVRGTLDAAVSDPDVADAVRIGRLVKPAAPTWGAAPTATSVGRVRTAAVPPNGSKAAERHKTAGMKAAGSKPVPKAPTAGQADDEAAKAAAEAELAAQAAREHAAAELAERTADAERANADYERLSEQLEQLRAEARDVAQQVTTARQAAVRAERRRAQAERRHHKLS